MNRFQKCLGLVLLAGTALTRSQTADSSALPLYLQNRNYPLQIGLYQLYRTNKTDIVMLGNSITFGVDWNELLGRSTVVNRGISSDVTEGYIHRLDFVYNLHPRLCFIMAGINDLYANVQLQTVFQNYRTIVEELQAHQIVPIIQSTLYVSSRWKRSRAKNLEVERLNQLLHAYADDHHLNFIDLNALMSSDRLLKEELTYDGLHLNAGGYAIWAHEVEKVLQQYGL